MLEQLLSGGFQKADEKEPADVVVVNSCTVTATSDQKARQTLRRAKKENPDAVTVLTGCMPQAFPDAAAALLEADIVLGNARRADLVPRLREFLATKQRLVDVAPHTSGEPFEPLSVSAFSGRTRAFLKIQDGCNRFCSYCIIPYARGPVRSLPKAEAVSQTEQLRQEGYGIDAAPKRGYTLAFVPERLDTALVRAHLSGHPWQALTTAVPSVDSTNNACKRLAAEGAPDGTAILTGCQTAGRGRRGRTFVSPPGGLYFSVILRPHAKPEALMHLTAMVAVAAARAVFAVSGVYPDIKWTNDLVLGGKKLCGILTEIGIEAESREVDYAVVGIGINCEQVELPPEVSAMSISLEAFTGQRPDRARLAAALVRSLSEMEQALFTEKDAWLQEFSAHCITIGQDVKLVRGDDVAYAHADGIDAEAALLVTYPDGAKAAIASGEVSVRGMYGYV